MMNKVESVNKYGKYWSDENQIFNFKFHPGAQIDLEAAQFLVKERIELCNGDSHPLLIDARGLKTISDSALKYFSSEEGIVLITAGAFIIHSFISRMLGNYYLKVFPPNSPSKLFTDRVAAIEWLLQYQQNEKSHTETI